MIVFSGGTNRDGADGGDTDTGEDNVPSSLASFEILDPTPGPFQRFGSPIAILSNGNLVVGHQLNSNAAMRDGGSDILRSRT